MLKPGPGLWVHRYQGRREEKGRFVVRCCFGGFRRSFVLSGSEECKVFVWHRGTGELLAELDGHSGTVNSVAWNPVANHMFASSSDDKSIHIWGL
jgi:WD repeat-containing protein 26